MFSRRWDPGIIKETVSGGDLFQIRGRLYKGRRIGVGKRCMLMDRRVVNSEKIRKTGNLGEQDLMKSNISEGNIFSSFERDMGNDMGIRYDWYMESGDFLAYRNIVCFGFHWCFVIVIQSINYGFDIIMEYLSNFGLTKWTGYKRMMGQTGQEKVREEIQEETREEGELQDVEEVALAPVSKEFQEALADTQAAGSEVISNQEDEDEGLQRIQSLVVSDRASERKEEDVMDMDEIQAALLEHGLDEQAIDALPAVSEEEIAEMMAGYEEEDQPHEAGEQANGMDELNTVVMEQTQKQGS
ncbi:hypothetical protein HID58_094160, partial [Brassica napus]